MLRLALESEGGARQRAPLGRARDAPLAPLPARIKSASSDQLAQLDLGLENDGTCSDRGYFRGPYGSTHAVASSLLEPDPYASPHTRSACGCVRACHSAAPAA